MKKYCSSYYIDMGKERNMSTLDDFEKQLIWNKGVVVPGWDPNRFRKDSQGALIAWSEYGMQSEHGWEIDHIYPESKGGSDRIANLQPLHWKNNRAKSDSIGNWKPAKFW